MKKLLPPLFVFVLFATGCASTPDRPEKPSNVSVTFQDPDKFTDARSDFGFGTDSNYLNILADHLKSVASRNLAAGQKLEVTFTDIDLAGEFLPARSPDHIRVIKEIFMPRMALTFKLTDAAGAVVKAGERRLTDMNFMSNFSVIGRNDPLFYDKALLTEWAQSEFRR